MNLCCPLLDENWLKQTTLIIGFENLEPFSIRSAERLTRVSVLISLITIVYLMLSNKRQPFMHSLIDTTSRDLILT
ncbi:hypothetical protein BpHYR1_020649 [Brachionus plicatilis]|uniref:Uncharacterized protein n=1 Tax=Brachionus plicatilis TaxID=10195 RepID=A0A3M7QD45_BRAPC|nr:hypothetical protein BpHYR1_020649 [Brachionus plicatilis]